MNWEKLVETWEEADSVGAAILTCLFVILGVVAMSFGLMCFWSWIVMLLWNWVAVDLFALPEIGFWVAFGLRWLCSLLFKGGSVVKKD